jgi:hypothetical protein
VTPIKTTHIYIFRENPTRWENYIYFDIETIEDLEQMRYAKLAKGEDRKKFLNPFNAKFCVAKTLEGAEKVIKGNAKTIALELIRFAEEQGKTGFCAYNGNKFDFIIFKEIAKIQIIKNTYLIRFNKKLYKTIDLLDLSKSIGAVGLDNFAKNLRIEGKNLDKAVNLEDYTRRDVDILIEIAKKLKNLNIDKTATRTGRNALARVAAEKGIQKIISLGDLRHDYTGGRTDIFKAYGEKR